MPYDAFISYSHSVDGRLAPALQSGLQHLARPWYRIRSLRVFRDETGLTVNPHLWRSIQTALDDSSYFVLLASPAAAASPWVNREIEHWCTTKDADHILPVLTDGSLLWDSTNGDYDPSASTALPPALAGRYTDEPRHLDLRWACDEDQLDLRHSHFREAVADLAAPIHGIAKEELESEDVRQHRRGMRLARAAVLSLLLLAVAAVVATMFAVSNAAQANEQADRARQAAVRASDAESTAQRRAREAEEARNAEATSARRAETSANQARAAEDDARKERDRALAAEASAERETENARSAEAARAQEASRAERSAEAAARAATEATRFAREADAAADLARNALTEAENESARRLRAVKEAHRQAASAQSRALASSALLAFGEGRLDLGMLLAMESKNAASATGATAPEATAHDAILTGLLSEPTLRTTLHGLGSDPGTIAFDPTGDRIAATSGAGVQVWDLSSGRLVATNDALYALPGGELSDYVTNLTWSSTGLLAFETLYGEDHIWDVDANVTTDLPFAGAPARSAFSPDGSLLAVMGDLSGVGGVLLWDVERGEQVGSMLSIPMGHFVDMLAFDPSGETLVAAGTAAGTAGFSSRVETVFVWNVADAVAGDAKPEWVLEGSHGSVPLNVADLVFAGTELWSLVTDSADGAVVGWDLATGQRVFGPAGPTGEVIAMSRDHRVVAQFSDSSTNAALVLRDVTTGQPVGVPLAAIGPRHDVAAEFSPDGRTVAGFGDEGTIVVWDWNQDPMADRRIRTSTPLPANVSNGQVVALAPSGRLAAISHAGSVQVLDEAGHPLPQQPRANPVARFRPLAFSPDGALLATLEQDSVVRVWDATSGHLRWELAMPGVCENGSLVFGPPGPEGGGGTVALGCFGDLVVWRLTSPDPSPRPLTYAGDIARPLAISPDGRRLAVGLLASTAIIDIESGEQLGPDVPSRLNGLAIDADFDSEGQILAIAYYTGALGLFDLRSGDARVNAQAHSGVRSELLDLPTDGIRIAFDSSGQALYSLSDDGSVRLWDTATFEPLGLALTAPSPLSSYSPLDIALAADGKTLVAAGATLVRWDISIDSWITRACALANRNLTADEWYQYIGATAYRKTCPGLP